MSTELPKCFFKKNSSKQKKKCLKQETTVRCYTYLMGYVTERERGRSPRVDVTNTDHTPAFLLTKQDDQQKILDGTAALTTPGEVRGEGDKGSHGE